MLHPVKKLSGLNQERNMSRSSTKTAKAVLNKYMWLDLRTTWDWLFDWRNHYYGLCTCILAMVKSYVCGVLVDYCEVFLSCLDSHSDGTHSLQSILWWANDGMLHFCKSEEETNSSTSWVTWGFIIYYYYLLYSIKECCLNGLNASLVCLSYFDVLKDQQEMWLVSHLSAHTHKCCFSFLDILGS